DMKAASADGISPFNLEKGDPCYLGIAVIGEGRKESIPRLSPDWADALEFDLTRIIARVSSPQPAPPAAASSTPVDPATRGEVQKLIPDAASVSLDDGRRIIREAAAKEFMDTATEMQAKVKAAEERFTQLSQNNAPESELKAALDQVRQAQAEQVEKLNGIAARAQERISAFEQLKSGAR
ncbi:MAG TPA: hypothetical protein PKA41_20180, partial [Verrucomicrobiota bacterium]|nr:hypothetical protein [Verrucomicrobiota bacterium]